MATINADHPQRGMEHAFRSGFGDENIGIYDYLAKVRSGMPHPAVSAEFAQAAIGFRPDWVWLQLQEGNVIQADAIESIKRALPKCVVSHWTGDLRSSVSDYLASICRATHLTLISSVGQIPAFRAAGAREVRYCQIGLDWEEDVLGIPDWTPPFRIPDVVFCGNYYGHFPGAPEREGAVRALQGAGIDVGVFGVGWSPDIRVVGTCHVKQQHHVWKRAKICLNVNNFNSVERYYSDRQLIAMASGIPLVCKYVPGLEHEFTQGEHCLWYNTPDELVAHVRRLLGDPALRAKIGAAGRDKVTQGHTWADRIEEVLPTILEIANRL